ncbi:M56 family metallopeptidase [Thermoflexibacter ruber]|uniref:Por secretion system C-terminal sorting domain-containing protein n=1 Tax=Thermoflexibacter ruber TaxID=1003 RepID=A0A1I2K9S0_9BACT|nr:M56 family metallopeptidase [Thermoflexibacter ruber]SFF63163.1 Por secretion system C-terminal sorting domain-containing protein [Thermoflexibacter ruber]
METLIIPSNVAEALGWTILHSLWQASIIVAVLILLLKIMKNTQANQRYLLSLAALFSILLMAVITFFTIYQPHKQVVPSDLSEEIDWTYFPTFHETEKTWEDYISIGISMANTYSYELSLLWLVGVIFLSIRFLINLLYIHQLKTYKTKPTSIEWEGRLRTIAEKINIHRQIKLVESALVQVPTVVGWLKPVILFPLGMFTALPPHEIESILAHELAHIRRNDFIINIVQSIVEILFFYHPAVWYISKHIENERENCCDDIAIAVTGDSLTYIKALTNLATLKINTLTPALAITGKNGSLLQRVSRIARNANLASRWARQHTISPKLTASMIVIMSVLLLVTKTEATTFLVEKLEKTPLEFLVKRFEREEKQAEKENKLLSTTQSFFADTTKKARDNQKSIVIQIDSTDKANGNVFLSVKGDTLGKGFLLLSPAMYNLNIPFDKFEIDTIESKNGVCTYKIKGFDSLNTSWSWLHDGNNLTAVPALKKMIKGQVDSLGKIWLHYPNGEDRLLLVNNLKRYKEFMYLPTDSIFKHLRKLKQGEDFQIYNYSDFLKDFISTNNPIDKKFWLSADSIGKTLPKGGKTYLYKYNEKQPLVVMNGEGSELKLGKSKGYIYLSPNFKVNIDNIKNIEGYNALPDSIKKRWKWQAEKNGIILGDANYTIVNGWELNEKSPLYIIDGEEVPQSKASKKILEILNPNEIASIEVLKGKKGTELYSEKGKNGVIVIKTKKGKKKKSDTSDNINVQKEETMPQSQNFTLRMLNPANSSHKPLFVIDGEMIDREKGTEILKSINTSDIVSINILKGESANTIYGVEGKNGVIIIHTTGTRSGSNSGDIAKGIRVTELEELNRYTEVIVYPNPTKGSVNIRFMMDKNEPVWIDAYDVKGHKVATISDGSNLNKGQYDIFWGRANMPAGSYIITIKRGNKVSQHKVILE